MVASFQDTTGKGGSSAGLERAPGSPTTGQAAIANAAPPKRTWGLWIVDNFLYTFLTNTAVFAISVGATYLTSMGHLRRDIRTNKLIQPEYKLNPKYDSKKDPISHKAIRASLKDPIESRIYDPVALEDKNSDLNKTSKLIYGGFGQFMQNRGSWLAGKFERLGMGPQTADMAKMVAFSFIDGSLMAPVVKKLEDQREPMARWIDRKLGTEPKDDAPYKAEPNQSWGSVLGGRFATVSIVVPVAVAMSTFGFKNGKIGFRNLGIKPKTNAENFLTFNNAAFSNPGEGVGKWLETPRQTANGVWGTLREGIKPALQKVSRVFGKDTQIPYLWKTVYFEAFYTSVCTAGLYISSRFLAGGRKAQEQPQKPLMGGPVPVLIPRAQEAEEQTSRKTEPTPTPKIREAASYARMQDASSPDLTPVNAL